MCAYLCDILHDIMISKTKYIKCVHILCDLLFILYTASLDYEPKLTEFHEPVVFFVNCSRDIVVTTLGAIASWTQISKNLVCP